MGAIKTILLTGATGFLGSNILQLLIDKGFVPVVYLRANSDLWRIKHLNNKYKAFIAQADGINLDELFKKNNIDAVIHAATDYGRNSKLSEVLKSNVLFPVKLAETSAIYNVKLFINTDTFFGKKQFALKYLGNYTSSKRTLEEFLPGLCTPKLSIVNLRIEHVYGGNDGDQKFVSSIIKQMLQNKTEITLTEGLQKRDFIYVKDVANAYLSIILSSPEFFGYKEFEVGRGESISVKEFIAEIADITKTRSILNFGAIPIREGEIADSFANTAPLMKLGWKPAYSIKKGLEETIKIEKSLVA